MSDDEMREWQANREKFNIQGLRATKHPEDVIKLLTSEERKKAIEAIKGKYENTGKDEIIRARPGDRKGLKIPGITFKPDEKDQQLLDLLQKHIKESMVRKYIRLLLTEAATSPKDLPPNMKIVIERRGNGAIIYYRDQTRPRMIAGRIEIRPLVPGEAGDCDGAWKVSWADTPKGWGPLLYDVAMEYATIHGKGLMPDRDAVSGPAENVWNYYLTNRKNDVISHQLDNLDDVLTPGVEVDNCDQGVAKARTKGSMGWVDSPLSKKYTKIPTTIELLRSIGKLEEL
jgi:hypothetical protein